MYVQTLQRHMSIVDLRGGTIVVTGSLLEEEDCLDEEDACSFTRHFVVMGVTQSSGVFE